MRDRKNWEKTLKWLTDLGLIFTDIEVWILAALSLEVSNLPDPVNFNQIKAVPLMICQNYLFIYLFIYCTW